MSVNKVILIGNVGGDPTYKTFENGGTIAQFSVATTKKGFTNKQGVTIPDKTEWHNIVLSNKLADIANQYVRKGDKLYIEGELRTRNYTDNVGIQRYVTEIYGYSMQMLSSKNNRNNIPAPELEEENNENDDLPF